jgi:hypothetical protein
MFLNYDMLKNSHHKFQISQQHNFIHIWVPEFTNMATQFIHIRVPDFTNFITNHHRFTNMATQTITGSQTLEVQHTSVQQVAKAQTRSLRPSEVETTATPHQASS